MSVEVVMPALSPTMEKGTLAKWLVGIGDPIRPGDPIAEVETDKATMEVEAADEGVLGEILVTEGTDDIPVGTPIAVIRDAGAAGDPPPLKRAVPPAVQPVAASPAPDVVHPVLNTLASAEESIRIKATPLAQRLAAANGIDLSKVDGSGPAGRIVKADLGLVSQHPQTERAVAPALVSPIVSTKETTAQSNIPHERVNLTSMRKTIARRLTESKQTIPHIYLTVDLHMDLLLALRGQINAALAETGIKVSVNDMLIKALALALKEVPDCNVSFTGDSLLRYDRADISVAVSVANGLFTPVVKSADTKSVSAISVECKALAEKARAGSLLPEDYQGGTASISNMGMMGIGKFEAIINPPQAMIIAIGAAEPRPVVSEGAITIATMMTVTGSFDHRAVDGADAAALMNAFRKLIEEPLRLLA